MGSLFLLWFNGLGDCIEDELRCYGCCAFFFFSFYGPLSSLLSSFRDDVSSQLLFCHAGC